MLGLLFYWFKEQRGLYSFTLCSRRDAVLGRSEGRWHEAAVRRSRHREGDILSELSHSVLGILHWSQIIFFPKWWYGLGIGVTEMNKMYQFYEDQRLVGRHCEKVHQTVIQLLWSACKPFPVHLSLPAFFPLSFRPYFHLLHHIKLNMELLAVASYNRVHRSRLSS